ncbi:hypothetical protein JHK87_047803 [Glycine soja]|nr:hypothetical protein JHK87_047803 [Glycine soja]
MKLGQTLLGLNLQNCNSIGSNIMELLVEKLWRWKKIELYRLALLNPNSPKHIAALKLQKVYESFRMRRKLVDCAILIEQSCLSKTPIFMTLVIN